MVSSRLAIASSRAGGVIASVGWHEVLSMSAAFALASWSDARLARCASLGWTLASISAAGHSVTPGCAAPQLWASEPGRRCQRYLRRTRGFNVLRRFRGGVGELIQRLTLGII